MKEISINKLIAYWMATAEHDFVTMNALFKSKRYSDSLFFAHIVLEKILKAHVVKHTKDQAPRIHDLVRLQELAELEISKEEKDFLYTTNEFNLRARYPDYKLNLYKQVTKEYAKNYIDKTVGLYKKLCQKLKQKK